MDFLGEPFDPWNDAHGDPDSFIKLRLSLLEPLFREAEAILSEHAPRNDVASWWALLQKRTSPPKNAVEDALQATMAGIAELNARFKEAGLQSRKPICFGVIHRIRTTMLIRFIKLARTLATEISSPTKALN